MVMHLHAQQHKYKQTPCPMIPVQQEPGENSHVSGNASLQHNTPEVLHTMMSVTKSQTSDKHH